MKDTKNFAEKYLAELRDNNAAVFVGAGLSKAAGYVDWIELLSPLAKDLGLDASKEQHDLVGLAQYHVNTNASNRHQLSQLLIEKFSDLKKPTANHEILARLPIHTFWTTNYDRLLEKALENGGKRIDIKYTGEHLATTKRGRDAVIYKMHGDVEHPTHAILTRDDYEKYHLTHGAFVNALTGDLVEHTFLFIGFSFTDPNLQYVLSRIRATFAQNQRQHFCITKRRSKLSSESDEEFEYASTKQELLVQDLYRYNIKTVFVDEYSQITELLQNIENRYRRRTIFVSGSAKDYSPWGQVQTEEFLTKLAAALIDKDYRITNGFGLGVGTAIVTGAVQQIYSSKNRSLEEQLVLRPFPIGITDATERIQTFDRYRHELIAQAGIAIFIMGNKEKSGAIVTADGVKKEFELAKKQGNYVVPIGASGSASKEIWDEVMKDFRDYFPNDTGPIKALMAKLGTTVSNPTDLIDPILTLINLLAME